MRSLGGSRALEPCRQTAFALPGAGFLPACDYLASLVASGRIHGAAIALGHGGSLLASAAFGAAAPTPGEGGMRPGSPIARDSIFEVASVTKPFTCIAVMQLIEKSAAAIAASHVQ